MIQIDMAMPENCRMCPVCSEYDICLIPVDGKGFGEQNVSEFTEGRPEWCPMKEHDSFLGVRQTADSITFISTGTAQQGEERGMLLGKSLMHEWIYKELLYNGLLTDDMRSVFEQAKRI